MKTTQHEKETCLVNPHAPMAFGMKGMKQFLIGLAVAAGVMAAQTVMAGYVELPVDLGTSGDFVILSKSGISTTGTTHITGDIGVSPIDSTAVTGFGPIMDASNTFATSSLVTGSIYAANYSDPTPAKLTSAVSDMETAYTNAAARTIPDHIDLGSGDITSMTLYPGLYKWGTGVLISAAGVTLSGTPTDVWIFQIAENLTVANGAIITLTGGAQASNIFWQVAGAKTTLGTTSEMKGIILGKNLIEMQTGATLSGRALSQKAVTLDANIVSLPHAESAITVMAENFNTNKSDGRYYGASVGFNLSGTVSEIASVKVTMYNAADAEMVANTSKITRVFTAGQYSSAFIVKAGTYNSAASSTWTFGTWTPTAQGTVKPAKAVITVTDIYGYKHTAVNNSFIESDGTWVSLFPVLTYTAGSNGNITGTSPQAIDSYGLDGSQVTAVPVPTALGYRFASWSDGILTAARTDSNVQGDITVTANFANTYTLTYNAAANGFITGTTPQTVIYNASGSQVTAVPNGNYHFTTWSDGVLTAARTDSSVQTDITVTANFASNTGITVAAENFNTNRGLDYYGVSVGYLLGGNAADVASVNVALYNASNSKMAENTSKLASKVNVAKTYSSAFILKPGTYSTSSTWNFGAWTPTATRSVKPAKAVITVTDIYGYTYAATNVTFTEPDGNPWTSLFPTLTYAAGSNGSIIGTSPQALVSYGLTGAAVTAVPSATYHFTAWSDGILTATRTDSNVQADISAIATFVHDTADLVVIDGSGSVSGILTNTDTPITANADIPPYSFAVWSVTSGSAVIANTTAASTNARLTGANGSSATVTANFSKTLANNIPETGIEKAEGEFRIFNITVPAGQTMLKVETSAGLSGDCDLYVKHGSAPTLSSYDEKSSNTGNAELIEINDPAAGEWYVMIDGYDAFSGVTLSVTYTADAPEKVMSLTATQEIYPDRISLTWAGVAGATEYEIWRSEMNDVELAAKINTVNAPFVTYDDMLTANTSYKYYYWVRAVNANYTGAFSDYAYGTIANVSVIDLVNGSAKTGISGDAGSMKTYRLGVPAGQTVFEVTVSGGTGDCDINVSNGVNGSRRYSVRSTTSENIQYSAPGSGYYYINIYGKTAYSGVTLMARYMQGAPLTPTAFAASRGTFADRVVLTWTASSGATSYDVYRALKTSSSTPPIPSASIATAAGAEYEDTGVIFGTGATPNIYYYWLKAVNPAGASRETSAVYGNLMPVPTAPGTVTASDGTYFDKIRVTWSKMDNVTSYNVYRTDGPAFPGTGTTLVGDSEASNLATYTVDDSFVPLNTTVSTKYYYWIKGINKLNGKETLSSYNSGYLSKKGPATVNATQSTLADAKIRLTWATVSGATSYEVYRLNGGIYVALVPTTTATSYEDTPGVTGISVKYKVLAKYDTAVPLVSYVSDYSSVASGVAAVAPVTLAAPAMRSVSANLYDYVLITWGEVPKAQKYRLYRSEANVFKDAVTVGADMTSLTYTDSGIPAGEKYFYWVTAVNGAVESKPSASMAGIAAVPVTASFADPGALPDGQTIAVAGSGMKGSVKYYSIDVPANTTRMIATLSGATTIADDCDVYAKLGSYPSIASYNMKGSENKTNEVLTISNPAAGTWYFMLYGAGNSGYTARTLKVACYSVADIYLTTVPADDMNAPFTAVFKGRVVDKSGTGIAGLTLMARNPMTGISSYLTAKTDSSGIFTYSDIVSTEGEHTFDFFFTTMPDLAKGTASHTVFTKNTSLNTSYFDFTAYLKATPLALSTGVPDDLEGMQEFLNTSNGWDDSAVSATYAAMWIDKTVGTVQGDTALLGKLDQGLYMFLYGVEGASAGNDTAVTAGVPVSGLSPVPLVVHVDNADLATVLGNLQAMGIIDTSTAAEIVAGKVGVVTVASLDSAGADKDISLRSYEQLDVLANIANNDASVLFVADGKYSDVLTKKFTVTIGARNINVITSAFVTNTTEIPGL